MFRFLRKDLNFIVTTSSIIQNPSVFSYPRFISTSKITSQLDSFTVSYLINSCGLSSRSALSASKLVNFCTPDNPNSVLAVLTKHGFSRAQISYMVEKHPRLLLCNPQKNLLPKLEFFYSKGFSTSAMVKMSTSSFVHASLVHHIIPTFNYLSDLLQSEEKTVTVLSRCLFIPTLESIEPRINMLLDAGLPKSSIARLFSSTSAVGAKLDRLKNSMKKAKEMGFSLTDCRFVYAMVTLLGSTLSTWESKVEAYKRWGWSEEEILAAFRKQPSVMRFSEDKILAVMELLVNNLGWESSLIAKYPVLITLSMKRLSARASILQFLVSKGLLERDFRRAQFFVYPETKFLQKFVNCYESYDEAPELLRLYGKYIGSCKIE